MVRTAPTWAHIALSAMMLLVFASGCDSGARESVRLAAEEVQTLEKAASEDIRQIRTGLPLGAAQLALAYKEATRGMDPETAKRALEKSRNKVGDLRVAKSTFFALVQLDGTVLRNDQEQDRMAGKNLFAAFPALKRALSEPSMPEAAEVRGRSDAQWVAAVPVKGEGATLGVYATGFSWSAYAYRLENSARSNARSKLKERETLPLLYVYVVVDRDVYGAPVSPEVNAKVVKEQSVLDKSSPGKPYTAEVEITGRKFALAAAPAPALGERVAIAVLRSEI
jgi:hypothetical protein